MAQSGQTLNTKVNEEEKISRTERDYTSFIPSSHLLKVDRKKWQKKPANVWIATKADDKFTYKEWPVDTIEKARKFTWIEGVIISKEVETLTANTMVTAPLEISKEQNELKDYLETIETNNKKFALLSMIKPFGVATLAKEKIKVDEFITLYAGEFIIDEPGEEEESKVDTTYLMVCPVKEFEKRQFSINAKLHGNISRFFPHLVYKQHLDEAELPAEIDRSKIAVHNLKMDFLWIQGKGIPYFRARYEISPGELAGFFYGYELDPFWLFYKDGTPAIEVTFNTQKKLVPVSFKQETRKSFGK